jgi:hypothetical protein
MRDVRLGDDIDDFCIRCKRIMNHAVVSVLNAEPAKVRCRTCHSDHDYRHEQAPPPKVDLRKQALFTEVLKKVDPTATPEVVLDPDEPPVEAEAAEPDEPEVAEAVAEAAPEPVAEPEKPKAKAKGRARK